MVVLTGQTFNSDTVVGIGMLVWVGMGMLVWVNIGIGMGWYRYVGMLKETFPSFTL